MVLNKLMPERFLHGRHAGHAVVQEVASAWYRPVCQTQGNSEALFVQLASSLN